MSYVNKSLKTTAYRIVFYEITSIAALAFLILLVKGAHSSLSTAVGGLNYLIPTFLFMWVVISYSDPRKPSRFLAALFLGEIGKLVFAGALFVLSILFLHVHLIYSVMGLAAAIVVFWITSIQSAYRVGTSA